MRPADVTTIKIVAIPAEHGASVMLGESLLAGLLVAASGKGMLPAFGWLFLFLMSNPFKILLKDISHQVFTNRTSMALWFCSGFGILALGFFVGTYILSGPLFMIVFAGVIPLGLIHLWTVVKAGKKEFTAELSGVLSLGAVAASIVLAAGHSYAQAFVLWAILAVRAVTSIIYVRERLNQSHGKINNYGLVNFVHIAGVALLGMLVLAHLVSSLLFIAGFLLVIRLWFLYQRQPITAKNLGLQESVLGIAFVVLVAFAF